MPFSILAVMASMTTGCASVPEREPRPAKSSLGCMQAAVAKADLQQQPDTVAHCTAAGMIARYCSVTEAGMASLGKELLDLFTAGDAQWHDLISDQHGVRCARQSRTNQELSACCAQIAH